ncbi:MAG TPA: polysaccharide deacetylase family protein, partial [Myxococcota bacterium]|nr:polysaccharide deacetylase family protein [Myxococcota bacterium]
LGLPLQADGGFGAATEAAVRAFQERAGLPIDGRVGPYTLHALDAALGDPVAAPSQPVEGLFSNDRAPGRVALTFDDGPSGRTTPRVLDILRAEGVTATFFALGERLAAEPALAARVRDEGHLIGNHSWSHPDLGKLSAAAVESELRRTHEQLVKVAGEQPWRVFRPPYGSPWFDVGGERRARVGGVVAGLGYRAILWNIDSRDWALAGHADRIPGEVRRWLAPDRGGVCLMHDIHSQTVTALPAVIAAIREAGLQIVGVADLLAAKYPPNA